MIQYGDIRKLSGYDLEPVDLIVGGSPCQDLSTANGNGRKGLDGSRSGLFYEMIRIITEMRSKTDGLYPRYALFENVPGLFTSNDGRDFAIVLGEFARIIEPTAPDVFVPKEGWPKSGILLVGSRGNIAYRTHDAQYWGVPQRRKELHLSQILEDRPHGRYFLSPIAAKGILKRAKNHGRKLPKKLETVLNYQAQKK